MPQQPVEPNRGGRPPKDDSERLAVQVGTRWTNAEAAVLRANAAAAGMTLPADIRSQTVSARRLVRPRAVPAINKKAHADLRRIGVNLNQLAARINAGKMPSSAEIERKLESLRANAMRISLALYGESPPQ